MEAPDEHSSESDDDQTASSKPSPPPPPGAPPPPPPPAGAKSKDGEKKLKIKATDQVPFESLRSFQAGGILYGKGKAWQGPASWHKNQWKQYTPRSTSPSAPSSHPNALKIVTYNILFASECMGDRRTVALLSILQGTDADIICLAEGTLASQQYHVADGGEGWSLTRCGSLILSKFPFEKLFVHELPSRRKRHVQIGVFSVASHRIAVGCVHLDSPPRDRPIRIAQLDAAIRVLASLHANASLLAGDFNFGDNTLETTHVAEKHAQWSDAWRVVHGPNDAGITFSVSKNDLTVALFPGEIDKRLDRVLYLSPHLRATEAHLLGTEPIRDSDGKKILYKTSSALFPSDHFGVQVSLTVSGDAPTGASYGHQKGEQCVVS